MPPAISPTSYVRTRFPARSCTPRAPRATISAESAGSPDSAATSSARSCLLRNATVKSKSMFESGTREKIQRSIRRSVVIVAAPEGSTAMPVRFRTICAKCPLSDNSRSVSPNSTTEPWDTTQIFWNCLAFWMLCVMANTVDFCGFRPGAGSHSQLSSMVITGPFVAGSCADVGSSRTTSGRRSSKVRAAAMRCRSPDERDPPF